MQHKSDEMALNRCIYAMNKILFLYSKKSLKFYE